MPGPETLILRIDQKLKRRLAEVARRKGVSMTTFVTEEVDKAVARAERQPKKPSTGTFRGVPTFFRAACAEAQRGGEGGYRGAGWTLALHAEQMLGEELTGKELKPKLDDVQKAVEKKDAAAVAAWFEREFPRCMELVPRRRREQFGLGVLDAADDRRFLSLG